MKVFPFYLFSYQIFQTMLDRPSDMMIWTGDHVYLLKPWQWENKDEMRAAYIRQRNTPKLKQYFESRPQFAIWDDHDFGPNNAGSDFTNKDMAQEVFREMWPNQPYACPQGVYFTFTHHEAQFFMLDGRYFKVPDSQLLGDTQLQWLCNELKKSKAKFKFICVGVQVLCEGGFENFRKYPREFNYFNQYIHENRIEGVVFLTGDVHYSEASMVERKDAYPLYDFTFSPLTSFPINFISDNKNRIPHTKENHYNFGEVSFSGEEGQRECHVKCLGRKGKELWSFRINENDLKYKSKD